MTKSKLIKLISLSLILLLLTACSKSQFMNLASFVDEIADEKIGIDSFEKIEKDGETSYIHFFSLDDTNKEQILLKLEQDTNKRISRCSIIIQKTESHELSNDEVNSFSNIAVTIMKAYTRFDEELCNKITQDFMLNSLETYKKEGELTKTQGDFYFKYICNNIVSEFIIDNIWLLPIPEVSKPEDQTNFGQNIEILKETVRFK